MPARFQHLLIICLLLAHLPLSDSTTFVQQPSLRLQSYLGEMAGQDANELLSVIIQKNSQSNEPESLVQKAGGTVTHHYPFMHAFSARVKAGTAKELAALESVQWVSLDAPLHSTSATEGSQLNLRDDFSVPLYNGSDGGRAWTAVWQEVGEQDGPATGDVAITSFWGGALQGLRLQGTDKGAWRAVDLANTSHATLSIGYRRKDFLEGDGVTLQLSSDGTTWFDVAQLAGPVTDAEIQFATYDISQYSNAHSAVRFVNHTTQGSNALFYLDFIDIQSTPSEESALQQNKLYLPLVSGGDTLQEISAKKVANANWRKQRDESQGSVRAAAAPLSSYVSTIRADTLWSTYPSLKGTGIGIAVVDSGVSNHWDLWDDYGNYRVVKQVQFSSDNGLPDDYYGHGTHIAGTIIGDGWTSDYEYPGVAHLANVIDVKVTNDFGFGNMSDAIAGLQWVFNNRNTYNIKVVNLSLNSTIPESYNTSPLNAAMEILWFNKVVVVVSAGNRGSQQLYPPANDPFVITVGATDDKGTTSISDDVVAPYSAFGVTESGFAKPDIVAPGSNIVSLLASDDSNLVRDYPNNRIYSSNGSSYFRISGTSMAAAVVSGAIALLVQDEPNLTPDQIKYRLRATARPLSNQTGCAAGAGQLDIYGAVTGYTTQSANTGIQASQLLWSGTNALTWGSVNWNSVNWNSVNWNSVNWNSVNWNSFNRNSVNWNSADTSGHGNSSNCNAAFTKLTVVNANTESDVQQIYDNVMLYTGRIGTNSLSIRAETFGPVESVKFELSGQSSLTKTDNTSPYSLNGDTNSNYVGYTFAPGFYTLKITAYAQDNASGTNLVTQQIKFSVVNSSNCELESKVRSLEAKNQVPMKIVNNFGTTLEVFWIDYNGARQSYGKIYPGNTLNSFTYATHPWVIARDSDNSCLYLVTDTALTPVVTGPQ